MTLSKAISQFVQSRTNRRTRKTYRSALNKFTLFLQAQRGNEPQVKDITENDPLDFAVWLSQDGMSKFTVSTYIAGVLEFLNDCLNRDLLKTGFSVERARHRVKGNRKLGAYPIHEPQPVEKIIVYYDGKPLPDLDGKDITKIRRLMILRARALVWFLYATCCRIDEARSMDRKHVADGRATEILLHHAKGDKKRFLFLPEVHDNDAYAKARNAIAAYVAERDDEYEPLFISHARDKGKRLSESYIASLIIGAAERLGIEVTPHGFRHMRACQLINDGVPLEVIMEIMGHADIGTTKRVYAQYRKETIVNAVISHAPALPSMA